MGDIEELTGWEANSRTPEVRGWTMPVLAFLLLLLCLL